MKKRCWFFAVRGIHPVVGNCTDEDWFFWLVPANGLQNRAMKMGYKLFEPG
jgi:hypothetical protein